MLSKKNELKKGKILKAQICSIWYIYPMFKKQILRITAICLTALTLSAGITTRSEGYAPPPFSRYAPILERMPFGQLPDKFGQAIDPNAAKQDLLLKAEQQKLASRINMSAVNITPQGATAIGFTDLSAKPPVSYYLLVGSEAGGWKVNSADYDAEIAEIEKDGVSISIQLGKGMVEAAPAPAAPAKTPPGTPVLTTHRPPLTPVLQGAAIATPPSASGGSTVSAASIRDKLRAAQATQAAAQQEAGNGNDTETRSYMERLRERKIEQAKALEIAQSTQRQQLEKLAREVASKEIEKQAAIAEETALEKELVMEEERLQKEEAERLEKQAAKETPAP